MKRVLVLAFGLLLLAGCTDSDTATRILTAQGFTNVQITGYGWWGCGRDDTVRTGFTATAVSGQKVTGVVCGGWGWFTKASTVRVF